MPSARPPLTIPDVPGLAPPGDFDERLAALGVALDPRAIATLGDYLARLIATSERMNLTAIVEPADAWSRHALDALAIVREVADVPAGATLVDVGSGGGVPGVPLAIARPDLRVVLVEATQKKATFLASVATSLGLSNVRVVAERAEAAAQGPLRGTAHVVVARAVARLEALVALTAPFARSGGRLVLVKGQRADEELAEAGHALRTHRLAHLRTVATPTGRLVVLEKA